MPHPPDYRIGPARPGPTDPAIIDLLEKAYMNNKKWVETKMKPVIARKKTAKKLYKVYCKALGVNKYWKWKGLDNGQKAAWIAVAKKAQALKSDEQET